MTTFNSIHVGVVEKGMTEITLQCETPEVGLNFGLVIYLSVHSSFQHALVGYVCKTAQPETNDKLTGKQRFHLGKCSICI